MSKSQVLVCECANNYAPGYEKQVIAVRAVPDVYSNGSYMCCHEGISVVGSNVYLDTNSMNRYVVSA